MPDFDALLRNRFGSYQDALRAILAQRQAAESQYASGVNNVNLAKPQALRGLLNNFAGRGMAFSTGYGQSVSDTNADFSNQLAALAANRGANLAQSDLDESSAKNSYDYDVSDIQAQRGEYQAQQEQERIAGLAAQQQAQAQLALTQAKTAQAKAQAHAAAHPLAAQAKTAPKVRKTGPFTGLRRRF